MAVVLVLLVAGNAEARRPDKPRGQRMTDKQVRYRNVCANAEAQIDMDLNNVRSRLLGGGDCWWNPNRGQDGGRYIVPKVELNSGQAEVSSLYAGSVWLGGFDDAGNLKLACQDYRSATSVDFWPGPIRPLFTEGEGTTDAATCENWDRHFRVTGDEIRRHLRNLASGNLNPDNIPRGVKGWPAKGNPYFVDVWGFDLPFTDQALAGFFDADEDRLYDPLKGDYPSIEIRGCPLDRYPDDMVFSIYNDQGGGAPHTASMGQAIRMEVQLQAFSYVTNDELNDMTFHRYKLINRAATPIDSTFFAMWCDPDLGCSEDDYIGCDTTLSLMYVYNQDPTDGQPGNNCDGVPTYNDKVPMLGVDYFRGPRKPAKTSSGEDTLIELGMSSFMYYNNRGLGDWPPAMEDPETPQAFYNFLTGSWADGTPLTYGVSGYNPGNPSAIPTKYAFPDQPNQPAPAWSMCTANLAFGDRRTIQASGPFRLEPGALNELIIGVPWVPDVEYPCPDMEPLFKADRLAQGLFNTCFDLLDGPDAPIVNWVEMNKELVAVLTNDSLSNNFNENYREQDFLAPDSIIRSPDPAVRARADYKFEGYKIYQLANPNVSSADFENPDVSRLVTNVDLQNNVRKIYNWREQVNPTNPAQKIYSPEIKVEGLDEGIRHTFQIKEDRFATGNDRSLVNHKKYYFVVLAYAHNEFDKFDPLKGSGQQRPYLVGRRSSLGAIQVFTVVPRPIVDQVLQASYGDGVAITRLEGAGAGGNFLDMDDATRAKVLDPTQFADSIITYQIGRGPINVTIFNPLEVKEGDFELSLVDGNLNDNSLAADARWQLRQLPNGNVIASERTIEQLNEQIVPEYGFSVAIAQTLDAGNNNDPTNGGIGAEVEYANASLNWLFGWQDTETFPFHWVLTRTLEVDAEFDQSRGLSILGNGWFAPFYLGDWRLSDRNNVPNDRVMTPIWTNNLMSSVILDANNRRARLAQLPNVDIVLTSDTSKWSRCVVVETASAYYTSEDYPKDQELLPESPAGGRPRVMFDVRSAPSVGKRDADGDGRPDPDGALNPTDNGIPAAFRGQPMVGMGWFPGYAVDVETGRRLNIFFGENSCYSSTVDPRFTGRDMLWNPTNQVLREEGEYQDYFDLILGGQHYVYVAYTNYDGCESIRRRITPEFFPNANSANVAKVARVKDIAWAGMLQVAPESNFTMRSLRDGLIPNDVRIKLRVDNPYQPWQLDGAGFSGHPRYQFSTKGRQSLPLTDPVLVGNALDSIKAVPNPYYGYSQYETSQFSNTVKITNLPGKCTVTIYSLDGKFIRKYERNEVYAPYQQISPDLEWDMKNNKGIPVASGVYLINVQAPGMGTRTVKWFGIARQFDPSGL
jgi:hypothetical protein